MKKTIKNLIFKAAILISMVLPIIGKSQIGTGPAPYCMPLYSMLPCNQPWPSNTPGNGVNDFIHSYNTAGATFNIVNNASGCNAQNLAGIKNYRLWGCQFYMITSPGQVITSNFQSGNVYSQGATVFVDWNNDGVYNPAAFTGVVPGGERVTSTAGVPPAAVVTPMPAWTVPTVPAGTYRMRVRCAYFTNGPTIQPCQNYTYGETEEYYVYVNTTPSTMTVNLTSNSPVCIGNMVNITTSVTLGPGSGTCTPATYTYNWTGPMNYTSNVMNPSFTATNVLQSGIYTLNITPGTGCGCGSTNTIQIWVNPNPSTSITNNGPVCQGSPLNFTNNVTGSGNVTYSWTGPNSYTNNTQNISFASAQPSLTGTYNFTVVNTFTNGGSCMATSSSSAAVVPVAQVSVVPSYTQCQGTNVNLNATVNGASSYTWNGPNSYTSNLSNPVLSNSTPSISGNYTVTTYFTSMSTTLVCSSSAVSNVSIIPMNPVSVTVPQNVCQNASVTFSANALGNPIYSWTGPNGFTSLNQSNTINGILPISSGNYSVNAIWSIGTVSCMTSNMTNISVVPVNTITVIPNITICNGEGTNFTANAPGAISYTWTGPNSYSVTQPNTQFLNLNPSWSGIYTVTAAFTNGNLTCYSTNQTNLLVKPNIQFSLTPISKLCFGQTLNYVGPNGATSYTWNGPGFTSNTQNLFIPNASTINIGTYNLTVDLNGCKTYGSVFVDVQDPIIWKNVPSNMTICKGESFTVTAEADHGSGNYAYNWNPSYQLTGPTGSVQSGVGIGTTIYNISVYDIACPTYTINHSFMLTVNQAPKPILNLDRNKACEPFCFLYDSKVKNQSQMVTYDFNGNVSMGDSINICLNSGQYTLDITTIGNNGCKETFKYPNILTVYPKPNPDFTWEPSNPNTVSDNHVTFFPYQVNGISNWFWEVNANTTLEGKNPTYVYENQGSYPITLVLTTEHGCKDTLTKVLLIKDEFLLWVPNAFTVNGDGLNDTFKPKGLGIKTFEMSIYDRWGALVYRTTDINKGWDGTYKGILCQESVYVYSIQVIDNKGMKHTKTGHVTLLK